MTSDPTGHDLVDEQHPSQAEGEDPADTDEVIVLAADGKPSSAEGEDPDVPADAVVIDPVEPV